MRKAKEQNKDYKKYIKSNSDTKDQEELKDFLQEREKALENK